MMYKSIFFIFLIMANSICSTFAASPADVLERDQNDPKIIAVFENNLRDAIHDTLTDPSYKRIPLDSTEDQQWFKDISFLYWHKNIEMDDFIFLGSNKFEGYDNSFRIFAKNLERENQ